MKFKTRHCVIAFFVYFCSVLNLTAQASKLSSDASSLFKDKFTGIRLGLYGESVFHPGLKLGTSYILDEKEKNRKYLFKSREIKRGSQLKIIQVLADANAGYYNHPNNPLGIFLGLGITRMWTKTRKMRTLGWSFDVNYLRRIYNIPTIELNENGEVNEISGAGTNSIMFALSPSFGKIYGVDRDKKEWHFYIKPSLQILKYDFSFVPNFALEIGASLNLFKSTSSKN